MKIDSSPIDFEVREIRIGARRTEESEIRRGGRKNTRSVSDGRTTDTHEAKIRDNGIVEEFKADRAESALLLFENAVSAEATVDGSIADGVHEERGGWSDAATVACRRGELERIHRNDIDEGREPPYVGQSQR